MTRRETKAEARERMFYQLNKEIAIGVDPIFFHKRQPNVTRNVRLAMSMDWNRVSKQYDLETK